MIPEGGTSVPPLPFGQVCSIIGLSKNREWEGTIMTFDISHLDKEPTRVVYYHGSAVFGHEPTNESDEIDPTSEVIEILPMSGGSLN